MTSNLSREFGCTLDPCFYPLIIDRFLLQAKSEKIQLMKTTKNNLYYIAVMILCEIKLS